MKGGTNAIRAHVLHVIHTEATSNVRARKEHYYTHSEIIVLDYRDKANHVIIFEGQGRGELILPPTKLYPWKGQWKDQAIGL